MNTGVNRPGVSGGFDSERFNEAKGGDRREHAVPLDAHPMSWVASGFQGRDDDKNDGDDNQAECGGNQSPGCERQFGASELR